MSVLLDSNLLKLTRPKLSKLIEIIRIFLHNLILHNYTQEIGFTKNILKCTLFVCLPFALVFVFEQTQFRIFGKNFPLTQPGGGIFNLAWRYNTTIL